MAQPQAVGRLLPSGLSAAGQLLDALDGLQLERLGQPPYASRELHGYVSLPLERWCFSMDIARDHLIFTQPGGWSGNETYLELGCGLGTKMRLAQLLGWQVAGIELHEPLADHCRGLGLACESADAREFEEYRFFDLVYWYRLCTDLQAERELLAYVSGLMRPGALLFHAGDPPPVGLEHLGGEVWFAGGGGSRR